jgi:riboflavin-specific deaminase-like protein
MITASAIGSYTLLFDYILSATPKTVAFSSYRDQLSTRTLNHRRKVHHESHSTSPWRCNRLGISSLLLASLDIDVGDDKSLIKNDAKVTGVTLKMAFDSSHDWGVADLSETKSERFTSPDSLDMVHRLRRESCAVLVGRGTVEQDDCTLTVRRVDLSDGKRQPVRVVIDPSLSLLGGNYTLLNDRLPTIIYHLQTKSPVAASNEHVILVGLEPLDNESDGKSFISPSAVVKDLGARGFRHVMVEGGPATARLFLKAGIVDRAILVRAPNKFEKPMPAMMNESTLESAGLQMIGTSVLGGDRIEYWTRNGLAWPKQQLQMWP